MNRVLIVDDEECVVEVLKLSCYRLGFVPLTAFSATQAIEIFKQEKPGIVLTDLNLGGEMDGVALCSWIRNHDRSTVLIAISGFFSEYDKEYCLAAGFSDFLTKPFKQYDLRDALVCALSRRSRWAELMEEGNGKTD